jgi:hypothetical protein
MKTVAVKFISADVAAYNARDDKVDVRILLNDGKDKQMLKQLKIDSPAQQAELILREIREKMKKNHGTGPSYDDDPLAGLVNIRWTQDEEAVQERLARFLATLGEKARNAKRKNLSYYELEKQVLGARTSFD